MTESLQPWKQSLFERAQAGSVYLGGLDDQISASSVHARSTLADLVASQLPERKAAACEEAIDRHLFWSYTDDQPFDADERRLLNRCAQEASSGSGDTRSAQMLMNLASYTDRVERRGEAIDRDEVMYRNLKWHLAQQEGTSKTIVWTSTVHAARRQGPLRFVPLGERLADSSDLRFSSIGFTAYAGASSMAGRTQKTFDPAPSGSLEAFGVAALDAPTRFIGSKALGRVGPVPSRLFGSFGEAEPWAEYFDGVVVVRTEQAPAFVRMP